MFFQHIERIQWYAFLQQRLLEPYISLKAKHILEPCSCPGYLASVQYPSQTFSVRLRVSSVGWLKLTPLAVQAWLLSIHKLKSELNHEKFKNPLRVETYVWTKSMSTSFSPLSRKNSERPLLTKWDIYFRLTEDGSVVADGPGKRFGHKSH